MALEPDTYRTTSVLAGNAGPNLLNSHWTCHFLVNRNLSHELQLLPSFSAWRRLTVTWGYSSWMHPQMFDCKSSAQVLHPQTISCCFCPFRLVLLLQGDVNCEAVIHATCNFIQQPSPSKVCIKLDLSNAFNSINYDTFFDTVQTQIHTRIATFCVGLLFIRQNPLPW